MIGLVSIGTMVSLTFASPTLWARLEGFCKISAPSPKSIAPPDDSQDQSRAERDFMLEMLDRNPDAFQGEMDILNMGRLYRCKL